MWRGQFTPISIALISITMTCHNGEDSRPSVAIVGGGLAGLSAAAAAVENGLDVELFEARRRLGGRASSFRDVQSGHMLDRCQHVSMGCCTNLAHFCGRIGVADRFRTERCLRFIGPSGRQFAFRAAPLLPAPLHLGSAFWRLDYLSRSDRWRIGRSLARLARADAAADSQMTIGRWLAQQGQSAQAIERFWEVVLVSALGETLGRASLPAAKKVFCDGLIGSRRAYELRLPRVSLDEIFNRRAAAWLLEQGVRIHTGCRIQRIEGNAAGARGVVPPDGVLRPFDFVVLAVPWRPVRSLLPEEMLLWIPELRQVERIEPAPISAIHLWFDRPIAWPAHAALVGRTSQWVFALPPDLTQTGVSPPGGYVQVVISGSKSVASRTRDEVVAIVRAELAEIWPSVHHATLLRWRMLTQPEAVFSVCPNVDRLRPPQATAIDNLMLAGDWTATGWPATMEGAVRSGHLAVEAILAKIGASPPLLADDLPRGLLARWLIRD